MTFLKAYIIIVVALILLLALPNLLRSSDEKQVGPTFLEFLKEQAE